MRLTFIGIGCEGNPETQHKNNVCVHVDAQPHTETLMGESRMIGLPWVGAMKHMMR